MTEAAITFKACQGGVSSAGQEQVTEQENDTHRTGSAAVFARAQVQANKPRTLLLISLRR